MERPTPEDHAAADAAFTWMSETYPAHWRRMYTNMISEGFTDKEAFALLITYIQSTIGRPTLPPDHAL